MRMDFEGTEFQNVVNKYEENNKELLKELNDVHDIYRVFLLETLYAEEHDFAKMLDELEDPGLNGMIQELALQGLLKIFIDSED